MDLQYSYDGNHPLPDKRQSGGGCHPIESMEKGWQPHPQGMGMVENVGNQFNAHQNSFCIHRNNN